MVRITQKTHRQHILLRKILTQLYKSIGIDWSPLIRVCGLVGVISIRKSSVHNNVVGAIIELYCQAVYDDVSVGC